MHNHFPGGQWVYYGRGSAKVVSSKTLPCCDESPVVARTAEEIDSRSTPSGSFSGLYLLATQFEPGLKAVPVPHETGVLQNVLKIDTTEKYTTEKYATTTATVIQ
jgi:hypothetical protein